MTEPAAISALLSASAVVGALTTAQLVTWHVEVGQLRARMIERSDQDKLSDALTKQLDNSRLELATKRRTLLWIAGIQWAVVTVLLVTAGWLAYPCSNGVLTPEMLPFFIATCALGVALVLVPLLIAVFAGWRLGKMKQTLK